MKLEAFSAIGFAILVLLPAWGRADSPPPGTGSTPQVPPASSVPATADQTPPTGGSVPKVLYQLGLLPPIMDLPLEPDAGKPLGDRQQMLMFLNLSQLAYENSSTIGRYFSSATGWTYTADQFISKTDKANQVDTQVFIAASESDIVVVFRGTEPFNLIDWDTDLKIIPLKDISTYFPGPPGAMIHPGFGEALAEVWPRLVKAVSDCDRPAGLPRKRLWIAGHSLGGALATLAAAAFTFSNPPREVTRVYTFGQPRVGDEVFATEFNKALKSRVLRVVNDQDFVAHLPPSQPLPLAGLASVGRALSFLNGEPVLSAFDPKYEDIGTLKWLDKNGIGHATYGEEEPVAANQNNSINMLGALSTLRLFLAGIPNGDSDLSQLKATIEGMVTEFESIVGQDRLKNHSWSSRPDWFLGPGYRQRIQMTDGSQDDKLVP